MNNKKELTYNGVPIVIKNDFIVTDFGEVSIKEIQTEYDNISNTIKSNSNIIMDYDYYYELENILEEYNKLNTK